MRRDVDGESRKNTPSARPAHGRAQSPAQAAQRRAGPPGRAQFTGPGGGAGGSRVGAVHAGVPADTGLRQQHVPRRQGRRPAHRLPAAGHLRQERRGAL